MKLEINDTKTSAYQNFDRFKLVGTCTKITIPIKIAAMKINPEIFILFCRTIDIR